MTLSDRATGAIFGIVGGVCALAFELCLSRIINLSTRSDLQIPTIAYAPAPLLTTVWGWQIGSGQSAILKNWPISFRRALETKSARLAFVATTMWALGWSSYCYAYIGEHAEECLFNCGFKWHIESWTYYLGFLVAVPIVFIATYCGMKWIEQGR